MLLSKWDTWSSIDNYSLRSWRGDTLKRSPLEVKSYHIKNISDVLQFSITQLNNIIKELLQSSNAVLNENISDILSLSGTGLNENYKKLKEILSSISNQIKSYKFAENLSAELILEYIIFSVLDLLQFEADNVKSE